MNLLKGFPNENMTLLKGESLLSFNSEPDYGFQKDKKQY